MFHATTSKDDSVHDLKNASNAIQTGAYEARTDLRSAANKAGRTVRNYIDTACDEVSHSTETVTTQIRENPVQSAAIALGVGFVLGALFRR